MGGNDISEYVRQQRAAGFKDDALRAALKKAGWQDDAIEGAMGASATPVPDPAVAPPASNPKTAHQGTPPNHLAWKDSPLMRSYEIPWNGTHAKESANSPKPHVSWLRRIMRIILYVVLAVALGLLAFIAANYYFPGPVAYLISLSRI